MTVRVLAAARPHRVVKAAGKCEVCTVAEAVDRLAGLLKKALLEALSPAKRPRPVLPHPTPPRITRVVVPPDRTGPSARKGPLFVRKRRRANPGPALKLSGWIVGSAGLASVIAGSVLVGLHGRGSCAGGSECEDVYETRTPGIVALAVGGAALAAAVTLYVVGIKKERRAGRGDPDSAGQSEKPGLGLTVGVIPGAAVVTVSGGF